jgi:hypothetical protein
MGRLLKTDLGGYRTGTCLKYTRSAPYWEEEPGRLWDERSWERPV